MKSFFVKILLPAIITVFLFVPGTTVFAADTYTEGYYTYTVSSNSVTITDFDENAEGTLVIPDTLGGYAVNAIGEKAFAGCSKLTSVVVPDSVNRIYSGAFNGCSSLEDITVPIVGTSRGSSGSAEQDTFGYIFGTEGDTLTKQYYKENMYIEYAIPQSLTKVTVTTENTITYGSFSGCAYLEEIILNQNFTTISPYAFAGCESLKNAELPSTLSSIGKKSFEGCTSLESVVLPQNLTTIPESLFYGCSALKNITFQGTVLSVGANAFAGTSFINNDTNYENGVLYVGVSVANVKKDVSTVVIKDGIQSVAPDAFYNCISLKIVTIPDSVKQINSGTFKGCGFLEEMTLPWIGTGNSGGGTAAGLFGDIFEVTTSSNVSATMQVYGASSSKCKYYIIPSSLKKVAITSENSVGYGSFYNCNMLESIILPTTTGTIENFAFYGCSSLKEVVIPDNYTHIYESAFENCTSLEAIDLPNNITSISKAAFRGCTSLKSIVLPDKITLIQENLFYNCTSLNDITILGLVTNANLNAFYNTPYLTNIDNYEDGALYIGTILIKVSDLAENVSVKEGTTSICFGAFDGCASLKKLEIPKSITYFGARILKDCMALEELIVPMIGVSRGANATSTCVFGAIFDYQPYNMGETATMQYYKNGGNDWCNYVIPHTLKKVTITDETVVPYGAFQNCSMIEELILPDSVGDIRREAFANCTSLQKITLPSNLTGLGTGFFKGCTSLRTVELPQSVTAIGDSAFLNCLSLETIIIPENVKTISASAFRGCASLRSIILPNTVTTIGSSAFKGCSSMETVVMSTSVKDIGASAFEDCISLGDIFVPDTVTEIYLDAFKNTRMTNTPSNYTDGVLYKNGWAITALDSVQTISVADGTKYIATGAFKNKANLTEAALPASVVKIGDNAFDGCTSLQKITLPFVGRTPGTSGDYNSVFGAIFARVSTSAGAVKQMYGRNSESYKYYIIPQSITEVVITGDYPIPYGAFSNCANLEKVTLSNNISEIYTAAFSGCSSLKDVNIPSSIKELSQSLFYGCSSLEDTELPKGLIKINSSAFSGCAALKSPEFPDTLESISDNAYNGCTSVETLIIPNSVKEIGVSAFRGCTSLEEITLPFIGVQRAGTGGENQVFGHIFGNTYYSADGTITQQYKDGYEKYYYIPDSLRKVTVTDESIIPYGAFYGCSFIDEIIIEGAPETLEVAAFANFGGEVVDVFIYDKQVKYTEGEAFPGSPLVTLYGYSDSTSEAYADTYGVDFVAIDGGDTVYTWQKYRINSVYLKDGESYVDDVPASKFSVLFNLTNNGGYANDMIAVVFYTDDGIMSHIALTPIDIPYGETNVVECTVDNRAGYADSFKIFMVNGTNIAPCSLVKNYR